MLSTALFSSLTAGQSTRQHEKTKRKLDAAWRLLFSALRRVTSNDDAPVAELADALDLGSSALWRESSSLSGRTELSGGSGGASAFLRDSRVSASEFLSGGVSPARDGNAPPSILKRR